MEKILSYGENTHKPRILGKKNRHKPRILGMRKCGPAIRIKTRKKITTSNALWLMARETLFIFEIYGEAFTPRKANFAAQCGSSKVEMIQIMPACGAAISLFSLGYATLLISRPAIEHDKRFCGGMSDDYRRY